MADTGRIERRVGYPTTGTGTGSTGDAPGVGGGSLTPNAYNQIITDASSFSLTLDSGNRNAIQWIAAKTHILIGTTGGEWRLSGHSNKPFTPTNYDLKQQTYHGSKDLQSIRITDAIAFVDGVGRKLHKLQYNGISENYDAPDLTVLAEHISKTGITSMAFQRNPDDILWLTLLNGDLISMTYDPDQNVIAWAKHPLPTGDTTNVVSAEVPETPAVAATYGLTFASENGKIWGMPLRDGVMLTLDATGVALNPFGGTTVSLPMAGHPFVSGMPIDVQGTTNYDGAHTLTDGTTEDELHFVDSFVAEVFDGSEIVVFNATSLESGIGRCVRVADGSFYYGHNWVIAQSTYVTKVGIDGSETFDALDDAGTWPVGGATTGTTRGMALTPDEAYLYILVTDGAPTVRGHLQKFALATGLLEWSVRCDGALPFPAGANPGYDIALDADGDIYVAGVSEDGSGNGTMKYSKDDGSILQDYGANSSSSDFLVIDDAMGIILSNLAGTFYLRTLDDTAGDSIVYVGAVAMGTVVVYNGFIYLLERDTTRRIHKLSWDGVSLTTEITVDGPDGGEGLYVDLYGNLVVINQKWAVGQTDVVWIYDPSDLSFIVTIDGMNNIMFKTWASLAGGAYIQGNIMFDGHLGIDAIPAIPAVTTTDLGIGANSVAVIPGTDEDEVWVSVGRAIEDAVVRFIERMKPRDWGDDMEDMFFVDAGLTYDGVATTTITGGGHLAGETVAILGDGAVRPTQTMPANGTLILAESASVVQLGLPYTYKLRPMRMDQNTRQGTSKGSIAKFAEVVISFYKTLNAKFGDGDTTFKDPWRESSDNYSEPPALFTGDKVVVADGGFSVEDPFQIEGDDPMPCNVRAIIPRKEVVGR